MDLGERINELRKKKGMSQEDFANKIGVSRQAVSKWESGQSMPDMDKIVMISDIFSVSTDYILKGIDKRESNINTLDKNAIEKMIAGCVIIVMAATFIWAYSANRFRGDEITLITLLGGVIGLGIGFIVQFVSKICQIKKDSNKIEK